ncbi:hypothetical protein ECED1_4900 [Escherichia coli ED1a]|uniref:Uncharacterized protein n=1 Tax=Escherichia coli O81 (strain ED1a) TaxID=585397 RepID=B7MRG9_ECO81|nr:hypothetical protein ECED1_4900 [Escherichia coli ED1a]
MLLQQGYAVNNMVLGGHVVYSQYCLQPVLFTASIIYSLNKIFRLRNGLFTTE